MNSIHDNEKNKEWAFNLITVSGFQFPVKLDTGAQANVISKDTFDKLHTRLNKTTTRLTSYSGNKIPVIGEVTVPCKHKKKTYEVKFIVTSSKAQDVLGLKTCQEMNLIKRIEAIQKEELTTTKELISEYKDVFTGLGCLKQKYHIEVDENVSPVHNQARKIPLALQERVKQELKRMEELKVIKKQNDHTDWASPMVIVEKPNKQLRLCMDPQQLNKAIKRDKFSIPDPEEIKARLNKAKYFTKLDATSGFWHIPLDAESSQLCTMTTPFGKYSFLRSPFGISSAPEIFNKMVKQIYGNEEGIDSFFDDILVWGQTKEELRKRERRCFELARKANLRFNENKSYFCQTEIKYLGHIISAEGTKADPQKVEAIRNLKIRDKQSLQRYLDMVTYVGKYIKNLSQKTEMLRRLLKKDTVWEWTPSHDEAVKIINTAITESPTLSHFDTGKGVTITCDASQYGLGAALLQEGNIIAYTSRTLTESERNYAQIEKEALSVVYACEKFHQFIYGRKVQVENDHKPLESIFKKSIVKCPPRIQRFMLRLQRYDLHYLYKPGKELFIADTLSRDPQNVEVKDQSITSEADLQVHLMVSHLAVSDEKLELFRRETRKDNELCELIKQILSGWPEKRQQINNRIVSAYWDVRDSLTTEDGIIFKDDRIVVPMSMRYDMLKIVHEGHLGIERCQRRARQVFYWPKMSADIQEMIGSCYNCLKHRNKQQKEKLQWHESGDYPWQKVGMDIFHLNDKNYLLLVDYLSKFVELVQLKDMRSATIISHMKSIFARHGIPELIMTDNAQNFVSKDFKEFCTSWEMTHKTSSPLYPQSNGLVERMVQTMKNIIKKSKDQDCYLALLNFRSSPSKDMPSPAEILMGRKLRTKLPEDRGKLQTTASKKAKHTLSMRQQNNDRYDKGKPLAPLKVGDKVFMRNADDNAWQPAVVVNKSSEPRSYIVERNNATYRRNRNQLLKPNVSSYSHSSHTEDATTSYNYEENNHHENEIPTTSNNLQANTEADTPNCNLDKSSRLQVEPSCSPTEQVQPLSSPVGTPSRIRSDPQTKTTHYKTRSGRVVRKPTNTLIRHEITKGLGAVTTNTCINTRATDTS